MSVVDHKEYYIKLNQERHIHQPLFDLTTTLTQGFYHGVAASCPSCDGFVPSATRLQTPMGACDSTRSLFLTDAASSCTEQIEPGKKTGTHGESDKFSKYNTLCRLPMVHQQ